MLRNELQTLGFLAVMLASIGLMPQKAAATDPAESQYRELVNRASDGDLSVDFRALRLACLKTSSCDPRGDSKDLIAMRRAIQAKEYETAQKAAERLIEHGFVNIEAHVVCAQAYSALNDSENAKLHHDIAAGLIRSILNTGNGKTKETAFEVIGTFEEHVVMAVLGLPAFGSQSLMPGKPHSYDCLVVDDPKTGQKVSRYFNIDLFYPPKAL